MPTKAKTAQEKFQQLVAFTEEQNAQFKKASKRDKRVLVAKDVLAALKAQRFRARAGAYIELTGEDGEDDYIRLNEILGENPEGSLRDLLPKLPTCTLCAKGAVFACTVLRQNEVHSGSLRGAGRSASGVFQSPELSKALGGLFSASQLTKIEHEFECRRIDSGGPYAVMGLQRFPASRRLEKIMRNIVANHGTFKPVRSARHCRPRDQQDNREGELDE